MKCRWLDKRDIQGWILALLFGAIPMEPTKLTAWRKLKLLIDDHEVVCEVKDRGGGDDNNYRQQSLHRCTLKFLIPLIENSFNGDSHFWAR